MKKELKGDSVWRGGSRNECLRELAREATFVEFFVFQAEDGIRDNER